jgi:tetratricopeptide (TPR) repeat protein
MKRLLVCLLLVGVVGCGSSPGPEPPLAQNESPEPPPVETDAEKAKRECEKGIGFADREDWATAIACFTEAIRLNPGFADAYIHQGLAYIHLEEYDKAISDYTAAIRIDPDDALAYNNRGFIYRRILGQYDQAISDYTAAIRIDPDFALAYNGRGVAYQELGDQVKADADFAKAKELGFDP